MKNFYPRLNESVKFTKSESPVHSMGLGFKARVDRLIRMAHNDRSQHNNYEAVVYEIDKNNNVTVYDTLNFSYPNKPEDNVSWLPDNLHVKGFLGLRRNQIAALPKNLKVNGDLYLEDTLISSLPDDLVVNGGINLCRTKITSLPDNFRVKGFLDLNGTLITSLPDNLHVNGFLNLSYTNLDSLPSNLSVYGDFYLINTPLANKEKTIKRIKELIASKNGFVKGTIRLEPY